LNFLNNNNYNLFYKNHVILIPIAVISYILISLIRFYSLCKIKWLLDYKFIPVQIFFILYNFFGMIILLIPSLITNNIKCIDKAKLNDIDLICLIKKVKGNNTEYHFDSFSYYFEQLWKNDRNIGMNILFIPFFNKNNIKFFKNIIFYINHKKFKYRILFMLLGNIL